MIRFIKSLPYHFTSALRSVRRNFAMSLSSSTAVTVTLVLIALFIMVAGNLSSMSNKVQSSVSVFVQIDTVVEEDQYDEIQKQIEAIANVTKVKFSDKEEQKEKFMDSYMGSPEYETIFKNANPLSVAFYVDASEGEYVEQIANECRKIDGVLKADYGGDSATKMIDAFDSVKVGGSIFVVALCFLAIFLISNTIKITIQARSAELAIMRNVGADNIFIKTPFMIEGMLIGILGSIIPILLTIFGYGILYDMLNGQIFSSMFKMQPPMPFVYMISLLILLAGMIVGIIGSWLSVGKYLKWKR